MSKVAIIMGSASDWDVMSVQMPSGIPVATMAIDGAKNAALYAVAILALGDASLRKKLEEFRQKQSDKVLHTTL